MVACVVCAVAVSPAARAVDVPTLYTAEVAFDATARDAREEAYEVALAEVILRVSGSELSRNAAALEELFPNPAAYVMQFRPGAEDTLWVSFDGVAIEQTLRAAGQTVWGSDRPLTVVWLAVDWGQGRREIVAADDPEYEESDSRSINRNELLRERVLEIAERRGLPLVFPLLDTVDLQSVTFSDIWGGFDERVIEASRRYAADSILIGRIRPGSNRRENWSYFFSGDNRSWNGPPEVVVGQIADLLASEFAVGGNAPLESVAIAVSGVVSVDLYGRLHNILESVSLIEEFAVSEVSGDRVSLRVGVRGGAERLRRALGFKGLIEQDSGPMLGSDEPEPTLEFFFSP